MARVLVAEVSSQRGAGFTKNIDRQLPYLEKPVSLQLPPRALKRNC
ncbi:MAG: hypothetical protein WBA89_10635 [Microcoleus sp.]